MAASEDTDFDAEELLGGLEGEEREARRALLEELVADGVEAEELREAVAAGRLALLPVERALAGTGPRYSAREIAEKAEVELELLQRMLTALGIPNPDPDEQLLTESDLESAKRVKAFTDVGLPEEGMLQVARTIGSSTARIAQANRELIIKTVIHEGDNEHELALRLAAATRTLMPLVGPTLAYGLQVHLLEQIRRDVIGTAELAAGDLGGASEIMVCFADLVDFTKLGERVAAEELGSVAGRLEEIALAAAEPPVRLVKMIGDAAMMVSPEPEPMLEVALRLVETADEEGEGFPQLRAGVTHGVALPQAGDWYGRPVNLASRVTGVARPGSVLADERARDAAGDGFHYSYAGERGLKGIEGRVKLYRVRSEPKGEERDE